MQAKKWALELAALIFEMSGSGSAAQYFVDEREREQRSKNWWAPKGLSGYFSTENLVPFFKGRTLYQAALFHRPKKNVSEFYLSRGLT